MVLEPVKYEDEFTGKVLKSHRLHLGRMGEKLSHAVVRF